MTVRLACFLLAGALGAQEAADRVAASFRDPSRLGTVKVSLVRGAITVKGYSGKEVVAAAPGKAGAATVRIEEENNVMTVHAGDPRRSARLEIQVPVKTGLRLNSVDSGIRVEGVEGEIEASTVQGAVSLARVAGPVLAHAQHGNVTAEFSRLEAGKPMSLSSFHGAIHITLPADTKATLRMQTQHGEIFSDFEILMEPNLRGAGKRAERVFTGSINGGGTEIQLKSYHGSIHIRKAK